jgi:hypothetical protein
VELFIRLLGCWLLCEVFAWYARHRNASHFAHLLCVALCYDNIEVGGDQTRTLTAALELSVMPQKLMVHCTGGHKPLVGKTV